MDTNNHFDGESHHAESNVVVPAVVGRSDRKRFLLILTVGIFSILIPPLIGFIGTVDAPLSGFQLAIFFVPLGVFYLIIGMTYSQLRIEVYEHEVRLALPLVGTNPWFPWHLQRVSIPSTELQKIEIAQQSNAYAAQETEKLAVLHTASGTYHFSSIWFPQFDNLVAQLPSECERHELTSSSASQGNETSPRPRGLRRFALCGQIVAFAALGVLGILALSGHSEQASTVIAVILLFIMLRFAFQTLRSCCQVA